MSYAAHQALHEVASKTTQDAFAQGYTTGYSVGYIEGVAQEEHDAAAFSTIVADIFRKDGAGGFFVGTKARLGHVGGIIVSQLAIYDAVKQVWGGSG